MSDETRTDRQHAAEWLRHLADLIEREPTAEMSATIKVRRQVPVSRDDLMKWIEHPYFKQPEDRDIETTVHLAVEADARAPAEGHVSLPSDGSATLPRGVHSSRMNTSGA